MLRALLASFATLLADLFAVAATSWLLACATSHVRRGPLEALLAWGLAAVIVMAGTGIVLGELGWFGRNGALAAHLLLALLGAAGRRRMLREDWFTLARHGTQAREFLRQPSRDRLWAFGLLLALGGLGAVAAFAEPAVYDALTYRLPRLGAWLQAGRMEYLDTSDPRLNYMPVVPEMLIAWAVAMSPDGYRGTVLVSALLGGLTAGATIGLARLTGLSRGAALRAPLVLLGMAAVVAQFTSAHTDLITTGIFATAFCLWMWALRHGQGSWLAGIGAAVALGAKGTLFYLAPGALLWVLWLAWRTPLPLRAWGVTLVGAGIAAALFIAPGFLRNYQTYRSVLGPREHVQKHHRGVASPIELAGKTASNLATTLVQGAEPNSQPAPLRESIRWVALRLTALLPARDQDMFEARGRHETLREIIDRREPDADVVSFGALTLLFWCMAAGVALTRVRACETARLVLVWSAGAVVFLVFFHAMQQWHPYGYRYFLLVAPWLAVLAAWGIEQCGRRARLVLWTIALTSAMEVAWFVTTHTHQIGWRAIVQPERSRGYYVFREWREWARRLAADAVPLTLALPENLPIAAFFRLANVRVLFAPPPSAPEQTAETLVRQHSGWVVVPAAALMGREGRVQARTWLFAGHEGSPFSLAAYRKLKPGESPTPVLYRDARVAGSGRLEHEVRVRTWSAAPLAWRISNPTAAAVRYRMFTPEGHLSGTIDAEASITVHPALPAGSVSEVRLLIESPLPASAFAGARLLELLPPAPR